MIFRVAHRLSFPIKRQMSSVGKGCLAELSNIEEFKTLLKSMDPVLIDFSAVWCGPCRMLTPVLEEVAQKNKNVHFVKVDIDKYPSLASEYNVSSVPYVVMFRGGKVVDSFMGAVNAPMLQQFLDKNKK